MSTDSGVDEEVVFHIYSVEYYSAIKRKETESVLMT